MFALTKTDLSLEWRRIAEIDAAHLAEAEVAAPVIGVSSALRQLAFEHGDRELNDQSGYPQLLATLDADVIAPAKDLAEARAVAETESVLDQLSSAARAELELLTDPARRQEIADRANEATARLEHLRGPGARWSVVVERPHHRSVQRRRLRVPWRAARGEPPARGRHRGAQDP